MKFKASGGKKITVSEDRDDKYAGKVLGLAKAQNQHIDPKTLIHVQIEGFQYDHVVFQFSGDGANSSDTFVGMYCFNKRGQFKGAMENKPQQDKAKEIVRQIMILVLKEPGFKEYLGLDETKDLDNEASESDIVQTKDEKEDIKEEEQDVQDTADL
jgi:hypothetical protein